MYLVNEIGLNIFLKLNILYYLYYQLFTSEFLKQSIMSYKSEKELLVFYKTFLENAKRNPIVASILAVYMYDVSKIDEGLAMYEITKKSYELKVIKDDNTKTAFINYKKLYTNLYDIYYKDREKSRLVFTKDLEILSRLGLIGRPSSSLSSFLIDTDKFYKTIDSDENIKEKLVRLKINQEHISRSIVLIKDLHSAYIEYINQKGESQNATVVKRAAFDRIAEWMFDIKGVARIALKDHPQLLESLGIVVKS
ncbi:MAG: hypothetical protein HRU35_08350 [Rickettsiaceae bacterium]|nr:hypothetical protein [Rickettsiaceae bacterium]